jgi:hypothetical protein
LWDTRWPGSTAANGTVGTWRTEGGKVVTGTTVSQRLAGEVFDVGNAFAGIKPLVYDYEVVVRAGTVEETQL